MSNNLYYAIRLCHRKRNFGSYKEAKKTAGSIFRRSGTHLYAYGCSQCGQYHLTKNADADNQVL